MDPDFRPRLPCNASYVERLTTNAQNRCIITLDVLRGTANPGTPLTSSCWPRCRSYRGVASSETSPNGTDSSWGVVVYRVPDFIGGRGDTGVEAPRSSSFPSSSGVGTGPRYAD